LKEDLLHSKPAIKAMCSETTLSDYNLSLSPESSDHVNATAGLLAFHIAGGLPIGQWTDSGKYLIASNKMWITVAGTAPE
jgi:hypothetical protein